MLVTVIPTSVLSNINLPKRKPTKRSGGGAQNFFSIPMSELQGLGQSDLVTERLFFLVTYLRQLQTESPAALLL